MAAANRAIASAISPAVQLVWKVSSVVMENKESVERRVSMEKRVFLVQKALLVLLVRLVVLRAFLGLVLVDHLVLQLCHVPVSHRLLGIHNHLAGLCPVLCLLIHLNH